MAIGDGEVDSVGDGDGSGAGREKEEGGRNKGDERTRARGNNHIVERSCSSGAHNKTDSDFCKIKSREALVLE